MARLGNNIIILANGIPIAGTKTDSIGSSVEDIETSSPYNGPWKTYVVKRKSWKITTNFLVLNSSAFGSGSTGIQDLLKVGGTFLLYVQDFRNNDEGVCGHAILKSVTINAQIDNLVKGKFEFIGNGPLGEFIEVESISLSPQSLLLISGDSTTLFPTISPNDATEKRLVWSSSNPSVATVDQDGNVTAVGGGSCTITCAATDGSGVTATCNFKTVELVDLGLPSGTLWATCNIGANSPEEFGDHFAWAETEPKENYSWETYKYCEGTYNTLTKYCTDAQYGTVDELTSLQAGDDAARKISNQKLWTPTTVRITELINSNNTTIEHTTLNGVAGVRITSKSNENSIFLPLAPYIDGETLGIYSRYMSRNNNSTTSYYSVALQVSEDNVEIITDTMRCFGFSVRPIYTPE